MSWFGVDAAHAGAAALVVALYAAMCGAILIGERRKRRDAQAQRLALAHGGGAQDGDTRPTLVVYASQTGAAQQLAWQTAGALHGAGMALRVEALGALTPYDLRGCRAALFIVSTCGEGDAPDNASTFVRRFMDDGGAALPGLRYGLLALGDREFARFCAFGRRVDEWLQAAGAQSLFERIEVDGLQPDALHRWQHELGRVASVGQALTWTQETPSPWRLAARRHLNPDSAGGPVFHLELEPPGDAQGTQWESGDLVRIHLPGPAVRPREYSIASTADAGRVHLLVRLERRTDGGPGLASGWLTQDAAIGDEIALTLLPHDNFRLGANAGRPLILVGNGTGIAGLRAHLAARAAAGRHRNWLVFGERQRAHDFHFGADVDAWQAAGVLERVDLAFSRDQPAKVYVQDRLRAAAQALRAWLDDGAAIYVCGSLEGMATGVEEALVEIVGRAALDRLIDEGRYRRDVY